MKILDGRELAGFIKERQARQVGAMNVRPKLLIVRDSDNPVITKYVNLKKQYGADIGVEVIDICANTSDTLLEEIVRANNDPTITGIIVQLPILEKEKTQEIVDLIAPEKDVDGLGKNAKFDSATATAINWLLAGYGIELAGRKIAIVGRGKLVGAPLYRVYQDSGYDVEMFHSKSDLNSLANYDVIITATGVAGLITNEFVKPGAVVVDAGTASEDGVLKGDVADEVRERQDLAAITPTVGGVGPLTVACLFEQVILATK